MERLSRFVVTFPTATGHDCRSRTVDEPCIYSDERSKAEVKFLHSMLRVSDPEATVAFFQLLGLEERRRMEVPEGKYTLIFLGVPGDDGGEIELTHNWDESGYA